MDLHDQAIEYLASYANDSAISKALIHNKVPDKQQSLYKMLLANQVHDFISHVTISPALACQLDELLDIDCNAINIIMKLTPFIGVQPIDIFTKNTSDLTLTRPHCDKLVSPALIDKQITAGSEDVANQIGDFYIDMVISDLLNDISTAGKLSPIVTFDSSTHTTILASFNSLMQSIVDCIDDIHQGPTDSSDYFMIVSPYITSILGLFNMMFSDVVSMNYYSYLTNLVNPKLVNIAACNVSSKKAGLCKVQIYAQSGLDDHRIILGKRQNDDGYSAGYILAPNILVTPQSRFGISNFNFDEIMELHTSYSKYQDIDLIGSQYRIIEIDEIDN